MTRIQTFSGRMVDVGNLQPHDVDPRDVAHALANLCRFTGHSKGFYSVAEHCVWCAACIAEYLDLYQATDLDPAFMRQQARKMALLHDAHEAYLGDIAGPIKKTIASNFQTLAFGIDLAIWKRFGVHTDVSGLDVIRKAVADVDNAMLATERLQVFDLPQEWPGLDAEPIEGITLSFWTPEVAEVEFLKAWDSYAAMSTTPRRSEL